MSYAIRFASIRLLVALLLGLCLVLGAHAQQTTTGVKNAVDKDLTQKKEAWPVRYTPK